MKHTLPGLRNPWLSTNWVVTGGGRLAELAERPEPQNSVFDLNKAKFGSKLDSLNLQ